MTVKTGQENTALQGKKIKKSVRGLSALSNEYALEYGVNEAFIINKLEYYIKEVLGDEKHVQDGRTFKKISLASWQRVLPFLSKRQIEKALNELVTAGVLTTHKDNNHWSDRTASYGFVDEEEFLGVTTAKPDNPLNVDISPTGEMQITHRGNVISPTGEMSFHPQGKCSYSNNTIYKKNNKGEVKKSEIPSGLEAVREYHAEYKNSVHCETMDGFEEKVRAVLEHGGIICGEVGCGKTTTAKKVLDAMKAEKKKVFIDNWGKLYAEYEATRKKESHYNYDGLTTNGIISYLQSFEVLVLDEMGLKQTTEAERAALYQIVNGRYELGKPTAIITNYAPERLKSTEGMGIQTYDRIAGQGNFLTCGWGSFRTASE